MQKPEGRRQERGQKGVETKGCFWQQPLVSGENWNLGPEKKVAVEWSGEVVLWSVLWRTATEADVMLTYLHVQAHHFLFILYFCHLQQVNFLRNKMNAIIISHLRGHLSEVKEIMFARRLSPHPKHSECWIEGLVVMALSQLLLRESVFLLKAIVRFLPGRRKVTEAKTVVTPGHPPLW